MMTTQILRLASTNHPSTHLLVQVKQTRPDSLDLKLVGTQQEHLYHAKIQDENIKALQANASVDLDEWRQTLKHVFLREQSATTSTTLLQGLETVAAIKKQTLTITIRKNIDGITQKLGSVDLHQDDEREEVQAFDWVDAAVANGDDLRTQLETLQASVSGQQNQVTKLNRQLDELVQAKKDHEAELLRKFAVLLNEKKLKIRDQQRLLNGAKVDANVAEATSGARGGVRGKGKGGKVSRGGKRKVEVVEDEEMEDEDDDAFEDPTADDGRQEETPPRSEAGDDTEDEDLDIPATSRSDVQMTTATDDDMDVDDEASSPPRRAMSVKTKDAVPSATPAPTMKAPVPVDDDDDETDDDEL